MPAPDILAGSTRLDLIYCRDAPRQVWNAAGALRAAPLVVEKGLWAERAGYDGVIVNCMLDPGVEALRSRLSIPVVGAGSAAFALAGLVGRRSALIYPGSIPVYRLDDDPEATWHGLLEAARRELDRGADVLLPACTELDGWAERLQVAVGAPVVPCAKTALVAAATMTAYRLGGRPTTAPARRWAWLWRIAARRLQRAVSMLRA